MTGYAVVIPTVGRESLTTLLGGLAAMTGPVPDEVIVVNDRPETALPATDFPGPVRILTGPGRGPAAARNVGWRASRSPWVVFVDDDVELGPQWTYELRDDLSQADAVGAVGVQGRLSVPLPGDRRPTDWERQVAGLATSAWITADMAYRRDALASIGGFDDRFPRAYREDAELALRLRQRGHRLIRGSRRANHPVRPAGPWVSLARQAGNADDALLRRLHGPQWRTLADAPPGRRRRHAAVTLAGAVALVAAVTGHHRTARVAGALWLAGTAEFAGRRIAPGPKTPAEVGSMLATSMLIPPIAVAQWTRGWLAHRGARPHAPATSTHQRDTDTDRIGRARRYDLAESA